MKERTARWLAFPLLAATVLLSVGGLALGAASAAGSIALAFAVIALAYGASGAVLASRRPENAIGWIMSAIGLFESLNVFSAGYVAIATNHWQTAPLAEIPAWMSGWSWIPGLGAIMTFLLLLFPDGRPPSPRWRWVLWVGGIGMALGTIGAAAGLWSYRWEILADPNADVTPTGLGGDVGGLGLVLLFGVAGVAAIASLVVRWRRAHGDERQQLRWFLLAAAVAAVGFIVGIPGSNYYVLLAGMVLLPASVAVAVLKYRLYELDVVIRKAVVVLLIAVGLIALSMAVLAWPLLASGGLSRQAKELFLVGLVIGAMFWPLRAIARRVADRVVYGNRATPYEVLAEFSGRLGSTYADEDVTARMAQLLREATGADSAHVWLSIGSQLRPVASAPSDAVATSWPADGIEVHYRGERLGGLSVTMPANDPLDPSRRRLVHGLADQAGPVLANVRLIEDLRASRRRIVSAQDARAKKIERDIHDGAQQQLVALAVQLKLAEQLVGEDPDKERTLLASLRAQANEALQELRDLARGIYPPLLADKGLAAALEAQARKAAVPTEVVAEGLGRYLQEVESAIYFSCLEALNNVAKYAEASSATVTLGQADGHLAFSVTDDGKGFDADARGFGTGLQGMADRLDAVGGSLTLVSRPGAGTTVTGRIPVGVPGSEEEGV